MSRSARRRARWTVGAALLFLLIAGAIGATTPGMLVGGGTLDPDSSSSRASDILINDFVTSRPNVVVVVRALPGEPSTVAADERTLAEVGRSVDEALGGLEGMLAVESARTTDDPRLSSTDGTAVLTLAVSGVEPSVLRDTVDGLNRDAAGRGVEVLLGGPVETARAIDEQIRNDLVRSEIVAIALLVLVLIWAFRGVLAAALPLGLGLLSLAGSLFVLRILAELTSVSVFALNVCTALGLGLAVDYSLLILHRFREELDAGGDVATAVRATRRTAVRTVMFSATIVAASLSALLVFPQYFIRSMAYAGIAVVAVTALGAVLVTPAMLVLLGRRLARRRPAEPDPRARQGSGSPDAPRTSRWYRWTDLVIRHRIVALLVSSAILILLTLPLAGLRSGLPDARQLSAGAQASRVQDALREDFPGWASPLSVVTTGLSGPEPGRDMAEYADRIATLDGVTWVDGAQGTERFARPGMAWLAVGTELEPSSPQAARLVEQIRALDSPGQTLVGGAAAETVDTVDSVRQAAPWAAAVIVIVTFAVMFLLTGGLLIPVKALLLNVLSLGATFGILTWAYQEGHFRGLTGDFQSTGYLDLLVLVLVAGLSFALAVDYEVFVVARIREEYDRIGDTAEAVRRALAHTGQVVTVAAALLCVVFAGLATSVVFDLKVVGVGLFVGVLLDATLIRCVMVPALVAMAGRANWWAPSFLRRFRITENSSP